MDYVYELPYARVPHPSYGKAEIPAYKMIKFSIAIQRGCFGGCTFCSITEHEGRIIQSRSEASVLKEIEKVRDNGARLHRRHFSDLGGPTANMYRIACKSRDIEKACRKPSCVFPGICPNLNTDHSALIQLYRKARALPGVKKILIASGVRYDLAIESPGVCEGARAASRRRVSQDRARGDRRRAAVEDDEARRRRVLQVQGAVRQVQQSRRQGAVPHPVLHRRASRHHRRGHARARVVAQAERFPRRPGAGLPARPHGHRHRDVSHVEKSLAQGDARERRSGDSEGHQAAPAAQGLPALSRPQQLACAA